MPTLSRKQLLVGLAAAGVLGAGIAVPSLAFAEGTLSASPTSPESVPGDVGTGERAARETAFAEALAKELGVPTDKVQAALEKVRAQHKPADRPHRDWPDPAGRPAAIKERLTQAVKDGKLTQEQADAITAAIDAGIFPGEWRGHHKPGTHGSPRDGK